MNKTVVLFIILFSLFPVISPAEDSLQVVSVMTYNINAEKRSTVAGYSDIAEVIKTISPDICGLQKVDSCNDRNPGDVASWLGQTTTMKSIYAPAIRNYNGSTGSYGIALLTNKTPSATYRLSISAEDQEQDRAALATVFDVQSVKFTTVVTHLAHESAAYRSSQITKILTWIDSIAAGKSPPVVIMGDFNAKPAEASMQKLIDAGFVFVKNSSGQILDTSTGQGINHILYRPASAWTLLDAGNPSYSASNRNPVWAKLRINAPASTKMHPQPHYRQILTMTRQQCTLRIVQGMMINCSMYTLSGRLVNTIIKNQYLPAGNHTFAINPSTIPQGVYQIVFSAGKSTYSYPLHIIE